MLEKLKVYLFGKISITKEHTQDLNLIKEITGINFSPPEIYLASNRLLKKYAGKTFKLCSLYKEDDNEIYLPLELKQDHLCLDFSIGHETAHAIFTQFSVAEKQLRERKTKKLEELEEFLGRKLSRKECEKCYDTVYIFDCEKLINYWLGKTEEQNYTEESKSSLDELTLTAVNQGFANFIACKFLTSKYGERGFITGTILTCYDLPSILKLPPSGKLDGILLVGGTIYFRSFLQHDAREVVKNTLNLKIEDLPGVRKEIINCLKTSIAKLESYNL